VGNRLRLGGVLPRLTVANKYVSQRNGFPEEATGSCAKQRSALRHLRCIDRDVGSFVARCDVESVKSKLIRQVWVTRFLCRERSQKVGPGVRVGCVWAKRLLRFLAAGGSDDDVLDGTGGFSFSCGDMKELIWGSETLWENRKGNLKEPFIGFMGRKGGPSMRVGQLNKQAVWDGVGIEGLCLMSDSEDSGGEEGQGDDVVVGVVYDDKEVKEGGVPVGGDDGLMSTPRGVSASKRRKLAGQSGPVFSEEAEGRGGLLSGEAAKRVKRGVGVARKGALAGHGRGGEVGRMSVMKEGSGKGKSAGEKGGVKGSVSLTAGVGFGPSLPVSGVSTRGKGLLDAHGESGESSGEEGSDYFLTIDQVSRELFRGLEEDGTAGKVSDLVRERGLGDALQDGDGLEWQCLGGGGARVERIRVVHDVLDVFGGVMPFSVVFNGQEVYTGRGGAAVPTGGRVQASVDLTAALEQSLTQVVIPDGGGGKGVEDFLASALVGQYLIDHPTIQRMETRGWQELYYKTEADVCGVKCVDGIHVLACDISASTTVVPRYVLDKEGVVVDYVFPSPRVLFTVVAVLREVRRLVRASVEGFRVEGKSLRGSAYGGGGGDDEIGGIEVSILRTPAAQPVLDASCLMGLVAEPRSRYKWS